MNSIAAAVPRAGARAAWRAAAQVFKPRIALEIMLAALAGAALAGGAGLAWWQLLALAASTFLAAGAAGALNHLCERDLDARMSRTRGRPFVTGALEAGWQWYAGVAVLLALAVCTAGLATNRQAATYLLLGALTYGVVYTLWLKRRTWLNIVIGGLAGSFAVLAGAAATGPEPGPAALVFALVLFLWTPPHFWSLATYYRQDYADAGVPMLPVVYGERVAARVILAHTVVLVPLSLLPLLWGSGWLYGACAAGGGSYFIWRAFLLARQQTSSNAIRSFLASLLQLGLLLAGAIVEGALRGNLVSL
jgi:protoheme IX farnesyltransferase